MQAQTHSLSPRTWILTAMIAFAVGVRLVIYFVPGVFPYNFTPVEAIALFGGAYFSDRRLAFIVPLGAMAVADAIIATTLSPALLNDWLGTLAAVYGCIALTTWGGRWLARNVSALRVAAGSFASAVLFFVVTNFATWLSARAGVVSCYVAGIPFFKGTLLGTLFWSAALFGGFELMRRRLRHCRFTAVLRRRQFRRMADRRYRLLPRRHRLVLRRRLAVPEELAGWNAGVERDPVRRVRVAEAALVVAHDSNCLACVKRTGRERFPPCAPSSMEAPRIAARYRFLRHSRVFQQRSWSSGNPFCFPIIEQDQSGFPLSRE